MQQQWHIVLAHGFGFNKVSHDLVHTASHGLGTLVMVHDLSKYWLKQDSHLFTRPQLSNGVLISLGFTSFMPQHGTQSLVLYSQQLYHAALSFNRSHTVLGHKQDAKVYSHRLTGINRSHSFIHTSHVHSSQMECL
jgi:hypothetical protein